MKVEEVAGHADLGALQPGRVEQRRVIRRGMVPACGGDGVGGVDAGERAEQDRSVADGAGNRASRVLSLRNRNDAGATYQTDRRFDADHAADRGGAEDRTVGFGADGDRAQVGRHAGGGAGAGAARIAVEGVGIRVWPPRPLQPLVECFERMLDHSLRFDLPRITAPAARSCRTTNASAGGLEPTSASDPAVVAMPSAVSMLSFTNTGMPWSGPRGPLALRSASSAAARARASGFDSITAQRRTAAVDGLDAGQVLLHQRLGREPTRVETFAEVGDRDLKEFIVVVDRRRRGEACCAPVLAGRTAAMAPAARPAASTARRLGRLGFDDEAE